MEEYGVIWRNMEEYGGIWKKLLSAESMNEFYNIRRSLIIMSCALKMEWYRW